MLRTVPGKVKRTTGGRAEACFAGPRRYAVRMFFIITLALMIALSIVCMLYRLWGTVVVCWVLWAGCLALAMLLALSGWLLIGTQAVLAVVLLFRWKIYDAVG